MDHRNEHYDRAGRTSVLLNLGLEVTAVAESHGVLLKKPEAAGTYVPPLKGGVSTVCMFPLSLPKAAENQCQDGAGLKEGGTDAETSLFSFVVTGRSWGEHTG